MENEIFETEIVEEIKESGKNGMGAVAVIIGVSAVAGAVLWNRVIKPVGNNIKAKLAKAKLNHAKKVEDETEDSEE